MNITQISTENYAFVESESATEVYLYPRLVQSVNQIYLSKNGALLLTASRNSPIRIWDTNSGSTH